MKKVKLQPRLFYTFLLMFSGSVIAEEQVDVGLPLSLANKPLAVETEGVPPNIMLLIDDSGSMACSRTAVGGSNYQCADDVFYAPGYDANKEYRCRTSGNVLAVDASKTLVVYVSDTNATRGMPYFTYGSGTFYTWGDNNNNTIDGNSVSKAVCFDPDEKYQIKLQATTDGSKKVGSTTYKYFYANGTTETMEGNFLNWYFSDTVSEWSDNSVTGGFIEYNQDTSRDHGYWTERHASNFITTNLHFAYSGRNVQPHNTQINSKKYPHSSDETFKNTAKTWFQPLNYHSGQSESYAADAWNYNQNTSPTHTIFDSGTSHTHSTSSASFSMKGMKPGVSYNHIRIQVANDVGKKVIRDLDNANVSLATFWAQVTNTKKYSKSANSQHLIHNFVELDSGNAAQNKLNKESLIQAIGDLPAAGGTPTAKSLTAAARYFFTGWPNVTEVDVSGTKKTIAGVLSDYTFQPNNNVIGAAKTKYINEETWCQKNAIAILTDGQPSSDATPGGLSNYTAKGAAVPSGADFKHLYRVAGALIDLDFLPSLPGKPAGEKVNIETFLIAMGAKSVIDSADFGKVGMAAGGGTNNFYKGNDGGEIAKAFNEIMQRIQAKAASVTAIAVSSVAEVREDNYAVQATYDTAYWSSSLKAFKFNKNGLFINPDDDENATGYKGSSSVTPAWEANAILNDQYIEGNATKRTSVRTRKVYTWNDDNNKRMGMRFGADNLTTSNVNTYFSNLPKSWRDDLSARAEATAQARYDLMMYLLGDVSNEEGFLANGKYRQRGEYEISSGNVSKVKKGGFLGDIVDSSPVYVKKPPRPWDDKNFGTEQKKYSDYRLAFDKRTAMVYVGTNRGYLHAFAVDGANAGKELFAYMPTALASAAGGEGYHYLSNKKYEHRFYVDLTPTISDVFVDFYNDGYVKQFDPEWRTVLVGGLRAGGKGYFALDITCPEAIPNSSACATTFNENNVLWEFTAQDDQDLGYTYGEPIIAKVNFNYANIPDGKMPRNGNGKGRWATIVANGYNSNTGRAVLFILFMDGPPKGEKWQLGRDYLKIVVGEEPGANELKNGLSSATAIDVNGDGIVDYIYAGDLKGKMWSFNVSQNVISAQ